MVDGWWLMVDGWWLMVYGFMIYGWYLMVDGWWLMVDGWWLMIDGWWLMVDGWWFMVDGLWLMVDGLRLLVNGWWLMVYGLWFIVKCLWLMVYRTWLRFNGGDCWSIKWRVQIRGLWSLGCDCIPVWYCHLQLLLQPPPWGKAFGKVKGPGYRGVLDSYWLREKGKNSGLTVSKAEILLLRVQDCGIKFRGCWKSCVHYIHAFGLTNYFGSRVKGLRLKGKMFLDLPPPRRRLHLPYRLVQAGIPFVPQYVGFRVWDLSWRVYDSGFKI